MELKKGIYFTVDSIVAAGIIFTVVVIASSFYIQDQPTFHLIF